MHWNHRVVRSWDEAFGTETFEICEVYYDNDGNVIGHTEAISLVGNTMQELAEQLALMIECIDKPVIESLEDNDMAWNKRKEEYE